MKKIFASQVQLGMRLPCDIYNDKGVLLWTQGAQIKTEQQAQKVIKEGYRSDLQEWIPHKTSSKVVAETNDKEIPIEIKKTFIYSTVLDALTEIQLPIIYIFDVFKNDSFFKEKQPLTTQINAIIDVILDICEKHPDEAIATLHMYTQGKYTILYALHKTVLATLTCNALGLDENQTRSIACAALTSNAATIKLTETLSKQTKQMSQEQKAEFQASPSNSLLLLTRCGVRNEEWLDSIYMHRENLDGTGFPRGLKDSYIPIGARILAIADKYVSSVLPNQSIQQTYDPPTALKRLYKRNKTTLDTSIIASIIKLFGILPPGTFVTLKDGGLGVIIRQGEEKTQPIVTKVGDNFTNFYSEFNITTTLPVAEVVRPPNNIPKKLFKLWATYDHNHKQASNE